MQTYRGHLGGRIEVDDDLIITVKPSLGGAKQFPAGSVRSVWIRKPRLLVHGEIRIDYFDEATGRVETTNPGVVFRQGKASREIMAVAGWLENVAGRNSQHHTPGLVPA